MPIPKSVDGRVKPFIEIAKAIAKKEEHSPTWVLGTEDSAEVIQTPFSDNKQKDIIVNLIKRKLTELNAEFYVFIHEAYMLMAKNISEYNPDKPVKDHEGRIECLIVNYQNREGFYKMWVFEITEKDGKRVLGKPKISDNREEGTSHEGRMVIDEW